MQKPQIRKLSYHAIEVSRSASIMLEFLQKSSVLQRASGSSPTSNTSLALALGESHHFEGTAFG